MICEWCPDVVQVWLLISVAVECDDALVELLLQVLVALVGVES